MTTRTFRQFDSKIVTGSKRVVDVLKELNDKYIGYRTEGIVELKNPIYSRTHEIYFSYVENFNLEDSETEECEFQELEEPSYELYELGIEPNHVQ